ncbi:IS4 family transposase [Synechocystis sp. LEGE 06083]|nr:IS4 family transposase [Synechocystis sp. LEGE 06083]MBE9194486.1 IS4 family transposase [Synechocystis sp. LEGE 06083]
MISNFGHIVKTHLSNFPKDDYPLLDTFKFVSIWLGLVLDQSQTSMRSMFKRLNLRGETVDISTFSKASKKRDVGVFREMIFSLKKELSKKKEIKHGELEIFPLDSTIVSITSKLMWNLGFHQVKLFSGINLSTGEPGGIVIHFGQGHDNKYGNETIEETPENGVAVMDRGFCDLKRIKRLQKENSKYHVLRMKNNINLEKLANDNYMVGTGKNKIESRVVMFTHDNLEFRLVTNLPIKSTEIEGVNDEEIAEIYKKRWQIELLWKFLKMHLKLNRLIAKNENAIAIQIYTCIIAYLILKLLVIPKEAGTTMLDKLRYLQAFMCEKISYVHWLRELALR